MQQHVIRAIESAVKLFKAMSKRRQQSLKEAFRTKKSAAVEHDTSSSDSELRLSDSSDSDITPAEHEPEAREVDDSQPSTSSDQGEVPDQGFF